LQKIKLKTCSKFYYLLPVIIWTIFILLLTGIPNDIIPPPPVFMDLFQPDKIVHLLMFGVYVYLFAIGVHKSYPEKKFNMILFAAVISGIFYGGLSELLQKYVFISRNCNIYDFIANTGGCFTGVAAIKIRFRKADCKSRNS